MLLVNAYGHCDIFEGKRFSDKKIMNFVSKKVVCEKTVVNSIIYLPRSFFMDRRVAGAGVYCGV